MSAFRFTLSRVLSWRETELSIAEAALERLQAERVTLQSQLKELLAREGEEVELIRFSRSLRGGDLATIANTRKWITQEKQRLQAEIADCTRRIEQQTAAVTEARQKVRLLERLRERRRAAWLHEENRVLEELAAESALGRWRREDGRGTSG